MIRCIRKIIRYHFFLGQLKTEFDDIQVTSFATRIMDDLSRSSIDLVSTNCGALARGCFINGINTTDRCLYEINFFATAAATYSVTVEINSLIVASTPFIISVLPGLLSVQDSTMAGSGCTGGLVSYYTTCVITSRDSYGNQLNFGGATWVVTLTFDDGTAEDVIPIDSNDGTYSATYFVSKPSNKGTFSVKGPVDSMFFDISQSPATVMFVVDDKYSVPITSIMEGISSGVAAGTLASFTVTARNKYGLDRHTGNETVQASLKLMSAAFSTSAKRNTTFQRQLNVTDLKTGKYSSKFLVTLCGVYMLTVTLNGNHIQGSPMTINVLPSHSSAKRSYITPSKAIELGSIAGSAQQFTLQAVDGFGNDQVYDIFNGPDEVASFLIGSSTVFCSVVNNMDGTYLISYIATVSGAYSLFVGMRPAAAAEAHLQRNQTADISLAPSEIVCSFMIQILPSDASAQNFITSSGGLQYFQAGSTGTVVVVPRDRFGNVLDSQNLPIVALMLMGPASKESSSQFFSVETSMQSMQYSLLLQLTVSGNYALAVTYESSEVPDAPIYFTVSAGPVETRNCSLDPSTFQNKIYTGIENTFLLRTYDAYKNEYTEGQKAFTALLTGPQNAKGFVNDNFDGTYSITFPTLQQLGQYQLAIMRQQEQIDGSPFTVQAVPGTFDFQQTSITFSSDPLPAGNQRILAIYAKDGAGNQLSVGGQIFSVTLDGPTQITPAVLDYKTGYYAANISATASGQYFMQVTYNGNVLSGSAISVIVIAAQAMAIESTADGSGLDDEPLVAGYSASISAQAIDVYGNIDTSWNNVFSIFILNKAGQTIVNSSYGAGSMAVTGTYQLQYILTKCGTYSVQVTLKTISGQGDGLVASSTKTIVASDTQSATSTVDLSNVNCVASWRVSCVLNLTARDEYSNPVDEDGDVFIADLLRSEAGQDSAMTSGVVTSLGGARYEISFAITASGNYRLLISRYYIPVSGSNSLLTIVPGPLSPLDCTTGGSGLNGAVVGFQSEFTLTARDSFGNIIKSNVLNLLLVIHPNAEFQKMYTGLGTYLISWTPVEASQYSISLLNKDESLASSPYLVDAISIESSRRDLASHISAAFCSTDGMASFVYAGKTSMFMIQPRNQMQALVTDVNSLSNVVFVVIMDGATCAACPLQSLHDATANTVCCINQASSLNNYNITVFFSSKLARRVPVEIYQQLFDNLLYTHPILNNPFSILVIPSNLDPAHSGFPAVVLQSGKTAPLNTVDAGADVSVVIQLQDPFGNALKQSGLANVSISIKGPSETVLQIVDNHDGTCTVTFAQTVAYPSYIFEAEFIGQSLSGFPLSFSVLPAPASALESVAATGGLSSQDMRTVFTSGQIVSLFVTAKDQYSNLINTSGEYFQAVFTGPQRAYASADTMENGYYFSNVTEIAQVAGNYSIFVSLSLVNIKSIPLHMIVVPDKILASACSAAGVGTFYSTATSTASFSLVAKDRFGNIVLGSLAVGKFEINLYTYAKQDQSNSPFYIADERCSGIYPCKWGNISVLVQGIFDPSTSTVQYVAMLPATYVLSITYDKVPIKHSPSMSCCNNSFCTSCITVAFAPAPVAAEAQFSNSGIKSL